MSDTPKKFDLVENVHGGFWQRDDHTKEFSKSEAKWLVHEGKATIEYLSDDERHWIYRKL